MSRRYAVIIPTLGRPQLVLQALESVYAQTVAPYEVIVVVDGEDLDTVAAISADYPSVILLRHHTSEGPSASRNDGIARATAEWVCFLDDDDIWHHDKQRAFFEYIEAHPGCRALRCGYWLWGGPDSPEGANGMLREILAENRLELEHEGATRRPINNLSYLDIEGRSLELMLERNRGVISSTMVHREVLAAAPCVPRNLRTGEDWLLFVNVATVAEWHLVPGRWIFTRLHMSQATRAPAPDRWRTMVSAWTYAWAVAGTHRGEWLKRHGPEYAREVRGWIWSVVRGGRFSEVRDIYSAASPFLPSRFNRWSVLVPPPVAWRVSRLQRRWRRKGAATDGDVRA